MGQFTTTYGMISPRVGIQAVARLLSVMQPQMLTQRFAQTDTAKARQGNTVKWRRYHAFVVNSAPVAEGVPPSVIPLTKTDYTAVLQQYILVTELTDVCVDLHEDNPLDVAVQRIGDGMAQVLELVTIDLLKSGTNVYYTGTATTRGTVSGVITRADFQLVERGFDRNDGKEITKIIGPTANVSTQGIAPSFVAMCHTDLIPDLQACTGFVAFIEYGTPGAAIEGEVGKISRHRICCSRLFTPWLASGAAGTANLNNGSKPGSSLAADVYPIICVAREAYGVVRLQGREAVEMKVRQPGASPDSSDPAAQTGSVAGKTYYAAAILCEEWLARIEAPCKATPQ